MKKLLVIVLVLFVSYSCKEENSKKENVKKEVTVIRNQKNIIDWEQTWKEGLGSIDGYKSFGKEKESQRVIALDPDSNKSVMWECIPDDATVWDGGFMISPIEIDKESPYIFVAWVKKTNGDTGKAYYAFDNVDEVTGEAVRNAYFIGGGSVIEKKDEWHTLVGYIYPSSYVDDIEADVISGLYYNGEKIQEGRDFKWKVDAKKASIRVVLIGTKNSPEERLFIWNPQLYKVDGTEPKLYKLL